MLVRKAKKRFRYAAVVALAVCGSSETALAVLHVYEGFDYTAGELVGQNGGTGFTGAWAGATTRTNVVAGGLNYTDTGGNQLVTTGNHIVTTGLNGSSNNTRDLALINTGTTWWSFIGERLSPHPTPEENVARATGLQIFLIGATPTERLSIGKGTTALPTPTFNWSMLHSGNVEFAVQTTKPILDQSFLLVRIDHLGDGTVADNAYLWVNPVLNVEPDIATADTQYIGALDFSYDRIRAFAGNATAAGPYADFAIDEIRLGSTFADVTPHTPGGAGVLGDYNGNNVVDAADYVLWRNGGPLQNEGDNPGTVNQADYEFWRSRFGATTGAGAGSFAPIPEPASLALLAMATALVAIRRPNKK